MLNEAEHIKFESNIDYSRFGESQNSTNEIDTVSSQLTDYPFKWTNIIVEITISGILAFCIFYVISEVHEIAHNKNMTTDLNRFNNIVEAVYLFVVFAIISFHVFFYRWNRNCWYDILFDNYPMLVLMCVYALIEIVYYTLNYISMFTKCLEISRPISTTSELLFMVAILPFSIICVKNNVRRLNCWLKMRTKIAIILSMVGCLLIFSRKTAIRFSTDLENNSTLNSEFSSCNLSTDMKEIHLICKSALSILELIDINYFIIAFILLINPLINLDKEEESMINLNESLLSVSKTPFSILSWISMVRFRLFTVSLSFGIISILGVALYLSANILINDNLSEGTKTIMFNIYLYSVTVVYIITIVYGIFYYFADIKQWPKDVNQDWKSDQYFNYLTSTAQLIYSSTMITSVSVLLAKHQHHLDNILISQIINYFFLSIQIMVQASCIQSASRRTTRKFSHSHVGTWKFALIPPVVLASFNFIAMIISVVYAEFPSYSKFLHMFDSENMLWLFMKDFTLPLTILNRFHGMTFFASLTLKQWN